MVAPVKLSQKGPADPELTDVHVAFTHAVGTVGNLGVAIWRGETTAQGVRDVGRIQQKLVAQYPSGIGLIQIVERNAPPPSTQARQALAELLGRGREHLMCSGLVFEEGGFKMAAVRAIVSSITLIARPGYPHVVFGDLGKSIDWALKLLPPLAKEKLSPSLVADAIAHLRRRLDVMSGGRDSSWRAPLSD